MALAPTLTTRPPPVDLVLRKLELPMGWNDGTSKVVGINAENLMEANLRA
jgi:hypothetical protein